MNLTDQQRDNMRNAISFLLYTVRGNDEMAELSLQLFATPEDRIQGLEMLCGGLAHVIDSVDGTSAEIVLMNLATMAASE